LKRTKRFFSCVLIACLSITITAGCGKRNDLPIKEPRIPQENTTRATTESTTEITTAVPKKTETTTAKKEDKTTEKLTIEELTKDSGSSDSYSDYSNYNDYYDDDSDDTDYHEHVWITKTRIIHHEGSAASGTDSGPADSYDEYVDYEECSICGATR
jgi:hypothetical protein